MDNVNIVRQGIKLLCTHSQKRRHACLTSESVWSFPPVNAPSAGGGVPKRSSPPASSRSPELSTSVQVGIPECSKHTHIPKQKGAPLGSALAVLSVRRADQIRNHKPHDGDQEEQADRYQQKHQNRALLILLYGQDSHQ